mmetsp:Transcript_17925/g.44996  ORF Transcript_17925/g.44996 Transcript_17925/m.44996 type:complete len:90 (+) Transcript_17925:229-498(+)
MRNQAMPPYARSDSATITITSALPLQKLTKTSCTTKQVLITLLPLLNERSIPEVVKERTKRTVRMAGRRRVSAAQRQRLRPWMQRCSIL